MRLGLHSGPVTAGVLRGAKSRFQLFGDTVNTAARMEQNSEAGKTNISETTYNPVKKSISSEYRGEVEAKGKGVIRMYYVG